MESVTVLLNALWLAVPLYTANAAPVLFGGGAPIDRGKTWRGARVLGDGKTWRGAAAGILTGMTTIFLLNTVYQQLLVEHTVLPVFPLTALVALPIGVICGDMGASFLKRRIGRQRGAPVPVLDQIDFLAGGLLLSIIAAPAWFFSSFTVPTLFLVAATPVIHRVANLTAYRLHLKDVPW